MENLLLCNVERDVLVEIDDVAIIDRFSDMQDSRRIQLWNLSKLNVQCIMYLRRCDGGVHFIIITFTVALCISTYFNYDLSGKDWDC